MYTSVQYGTATLFIFHRREAEKRRWLRTWKDGSTEMASGSKDIRLSTHDFPLNHHMSQRVARASESNGANSLNLWHEKTGSRWEIFYTDEAYTGD